MDIDNSKRNGVDFRYSFGNEEVHVFSFLFNHLQRFARDNRTLTFPSS